MNNWIKDLKERAVFWGNNCGGCETCSTTFGGSEFVVEPRDIYEIIGMLENTTKALETISKIRSPHPDLSISKYEDTIEIMKNIAEEALKNK